MGSNTSFKKKPAETDVLPWVDSRVDPTQLPCVPYETDVGPTIWEKYKIGKKIGEGNFGEVRKARLLSDRQTRRAVKIVQCRDGHTFDREDVILRQISHRNIVCFHDVYRTQDLRYIVIELCKGGQLFTSIIKRKAYYESDAAKAAADMLAAIRYLHGVSIVHRDIKAQNFLLADTTDESTIKLSDFGFACRFSPGHYLTELCGSPRSLAPELIDRHYNHMVDMWAFGVVMHLMMCGDYPFKADKVKEMRRMMSRPVKLKKGLSLSTAGQTFILDLLQVDTSRRLTAREALRHSFMGLSPQLTFGRAASPASITSVNSNVHAAVQSAQLQIDTQKGQKYFPPAEENEQSTMSEVVEPQAIWDEEPLSASTSASSSLPAAEQIQQGRYSAAAAAQNSTAVLAGGFKTRSFVRKVSGAPGSDWAKLPDIKPREKELPKLHSLLPGECDHMPGECHSPEVERQKTISSSRTTYPSASESRAVER